jgi:hypothetical protein
VRHLIVAIEDVDAEVGHVGREFPRFWQRDPAAGRIVIQPRHRPIGDLLDVDLALETAAHGGDYELGPRQQNRLEVDHGHEVEVVAIFF